jgi:hypothetical protein
MKTTELCRIMAKHGSDKSPLWKGKRKPHDYTILYDELFSKWRREFLMVFECGIHSGGSLRAWNEYFSDAVVVGIDVKESSMLDDVDGVITFWIDQTDQERVRGILQIFGGRKYEIIVDDGLHRPEGAIPFFTEAFPYLSEDGYYIVEDIKPKYLEETLAGMKAAHPEADITVHDRRYPGSKYDNILIIARHGNS